MTNTIYVLYEHPTGFALFKTPTENAEDLESISKKVIATTNHEEFTKIIPMESYWLFEKPNQALENLNILTIPGLPEDLVTFLNKHLLKKAKKGLVQLGVAHRSLAEVIMAPDSVLNGKIECLCNDEIDIIIRAIRQYYQQIIPGMTRETENKLHIALALAYSRSQVKFNAHRADTMIIQCINFVDTLDKDINLYLMRIREWFSYHFPELVKLVTDTTQYLRVVEAIGSRNGATEDKIQVIEDITMDSAVAKAIVNAAANSMGMDVTDSDNEHMVMFTKHALKLIQDRAEALAFLREKLSFVAPNLETIVGPHVAARLISHAGSLTNLAKFPASTLQILGAEKALFRAIKTRSRTPKYGLIFNCSQIGQADRLNKGRVSRILASKCSMAARIDCFEEVPNNIYGEFMRKYIDECLRCFKTGEEPPRTADAMIEAVVAAKKWKSENEVEMGEEATEAVPSRKRKHQENNESLNNNNDDDSKLFSPEKKKKRKSVNFANGEEQDISVKQEVLDEGDDSQVEKKKKRKKKNRESSELNNSESVVNVEVKEENVSISEANDSIKKKKKKKNRKDANESALSEQSAGEQISTTNSPKKKTKKEKLSDDDDQQQNHPAPPLTIVEEVSVEKKKKKKKNRQSIE